MNKAISLIFSILFFLSYVVKADNVDFIPKNSLFSLEETTINSIHNALKNHQLTCEQLVNLYLERIKKYNLSTAEFAPINAFSEINQNVIEQARQLDKMHANTQQLMGPLHCIPVILKDNIDTYDATTTSGSLALLGNQPTQDAFLVIELRKAGAIILGKGGMDELAAGMFGISSRTGRIGNVYDTENNPGGSSGGSAAAISANFAVIGIGTDNSGSVRIPAAFNGVYGLRPSTGLISQSGIFPSGNLDGTAGPLTRTVQDLATVLDVIAKVNPDDAKIGNVPREKTYAVYLNEDGLTGKHIGIVHQVGTRNVFKDMPDDIVHLFRQSLHRMKKSGAIIIDEVNLPEFNTDRTPNMAGMRQDVDHYLSSYPSVRKNFQDLCDSNRTRVFGEVQKCIKFFASMPIKYGPKYEKALAVFAKNRTYVERIMKQQKLDALLMPISTVGIATYDPDEVNTWLAPVSSNSGLPAITINFGYNRHQMPIGVELIGTQFSEGKLIEMAYSYEKKSQPRIKPKMPEENKSLQKLDIPAYNNLITNIGYRTYMNVLINSVGNQPKELKAKQFKTLVNKEINNLNKIHLKN
ncbi:amidase [Legionella gratiana]|uniref:Amidase n=1 Tax=Legionella gratiana TaxID=45066 RepID=A0A378JJ00_9GAMM|nr:amidase family protein [Legionella gratiana]KTD10997.1 amidase [Legionella gratiana]STX44660.1 amidase [Legionella gratiana]